MTTTVKTCFKCGEEKDLAAFYKHAQMADGHLNKCITCAKSDVREHREKNINRIRAYDRERVSRQTPQRSRELYAISPNRSISYRKKYCKENRHKRIASNAVNNAVRDGTAYQVAM